MRRFVLAITMICSIGSIAQAQSLRSDSPLWTYETERDPDLYPEFFFDSESFGCSAPFRFGDYRRVSTTEDEPELFIHLAIAGLQHCALTYGQTYVRNDVSKAFDDIAWLIDLGELQSSDNRLFALQIGYQAGSRYILLRRRGTTLSSQLEELDWRCPMDAERRVAQIDVWTQDVCVVASKAALRRIARTASRRPASAAWEILQNDDPADAGSQNH